MRSKPNGTRTQTHAEWPCRSIRVASCLKVSHHSRLKIPQFETFYSLRNPKERMTGTLPERNGAKDWYFGRCGQGAAFSRPGNCQRVQSVDRAAPQHNVCTGMVGECPAYLSSLG